MKQTQNILTTEETALNQNKIYTETESYHENYEAEKTPWTFRLLSGKLVEDSDIGPTKKTMQVANLRNMLISGLLAELCSLVNISMLLILSLNYSLDLNLYHLFSAPFYAFLLVVKILITVVSETVIYRKIRRQEELYLKLRYLRYDHEEKEFKKSRMKDFKVGDLVLIRKGELSPADIVVLNSSKVERGQRIFKVLNSDERQIKAYDSKNALKATSSMISPSSPNFKDYSQNVGLVVPKLNGTISYRPPESFNSESSHGQSSIVGSFKMTNDPKAYLLEEKNIIEFSSKLSTDWVYGIILYTGVDTKTLRKMSNLYNVKKLFKKSYCQYYRIENGVFKFLVPGFLALSLFSYLSYSALDTMSSNDEWIQSETGTGYSQVKIFLRVFLDLLPGIGYLNSVFYRIISCLQVKMTEDKYNNEEKRMKEEEEKREKERLEKEKKEAEAVMKSPAPGSRFKLGEKSSILGINQRDHEFDEDEEDTAEKKGRISRSQRQNRRKRFMERDLSDYSAARSRKGGRRGMTFDPRARRRSSIRIPVPKMTRTQSHNSEKEELSIKKEQIRRLLKMRRFTSKKMITRKMVGRNRRMHMGRQRRTSFKLNLMKMDEMNRVIRMKEDRKRKEEEEKKKKLEEAELKQATKLSVSSLGSIMETDQQVDEEDSKKLKVFNNNSFLELGSINQVIFAKSGVLTLGDTFVGSFTSRCSMYLIDIGRISNLRKEYGKNPQSFVHRHKLIEEKDDQIKESYSEKSQEFDKELNFEYVPEVFDEDEESFGEIMKGVFEDQRELKPKSSAFGLNQVSANSPNNLSFMGDESKNSDEEGMTDDAEDGKSGILIDFENLGKHNMKLFEIQMRARERKFREEMSVSNSVTSGSRSPISPMSPLKPLKGKLNYHDLNTFNRETLPPSCMKGSKFLEQEFFIHHLNSEREEISLLLKAISVCHEKPLQDEKEEIQVSNLDQAIMDFLEQMDVEVEVSRCGKGKYERIYEVTQKKKVTNYNILALKINNKDKRVSVVVNEPLKGKANFSFYTRGEYSSMKPLLNLNESEKAGLKHMIASYKVKGFSPVVYGYKTLSTKDISNYMDFTQNSSLRSMISKKKRNGTNMKRLVEAMESQLSFIGCIGVGEVVNQEAKNIIDALKKADIGVGILSEGDASSTLETCKRLGIYDPDSSSGSKVYNINRGSGVMISRDLRGIMEEFYRDLKQMKINEIERIMKHGKKPETTKATVDLDSKRKQLISTTTSFKRCIVVSGEALRFLKRNKFMANNFMFIASFCSKIIGYNFNSMDKKDMITMLQKSRKRILAVGTNIKDIEMVKASNIGIQLCSNKMQVVYGDITIMSLNFLKNLILRDGVHFQVNFYITLLLLFWFNLNFVLHCYVYQYNGFFSNSLFEGVAYSLLSTTVYLLAGNDLLSRSSRMLLQQGIWDDLLGDYFCRKKMLLHNFFKILGVLSLLAICEAFYLDYSGSLLLAPSTTDDGYSTPTHVLKFSYLLVILFTNVIKISIMSGQAKFTLIALGTFVGAFVVKTILYAMGKTFMDETFPIYHVFNNLSLAIFTASSIMTLSLINFIVISVVKYRLVFSLQKHILRFWNFRVPPSISMAIVKKKLDEIRHKFRLTFKNRFERTKALFQSSKHLDPIMIKIFGYDSQEKSRLINDLTCQIIDSSKKQRYDIRRRKTRSGHTKTLLFFIIVYEILTIVLAIFKKSRSSFLNYLFKTTPLYNLIAYTFLLALLYLRPQIKNFRIIAFRVFFVNALIDLALGVLFRVDSFGDDLSIFNFTNLKVIVLPFGFGFTRCLIIYPILVLSNVFRFEGLGETMKFFTLEFHIRCVVAIGIFVLGWIGYKYKYEYLMKIDFLSKLRIMMELEDSQEKIAMLLPSFVTEKMKSLDMSQNFLADDAGEVTILFCDICDFNEIINDCKDKIIDILDDIFRAFDLFCKEEGIQKIETVGKTYMACGGLKFLESKLTLAQRANNPCKRVINVAKKMMKFIKTYEYSPGKHLVIKVGIHYGNCIIGLLGYHKPQFSLIGDTVNTTSRHCTTGDSASIILSGTAYQQIEDDPKIKIKEKTVWMKGKGDVITYILRENLKKNKAANFRDLFNKRSDAETPMQRRFNLNLQNTFSRMSSNYSLDSNPLSVESSRTKKMGKRIMTLSGLKSKHNFGFFSKIKSSFGIKNKDSKDPKEATKKKKRRNKKMVIKRTEEFEAFYIDNLLRSNQNFTKICLLLTALDCFVRGITAIFEISIVQGLIYLRVADFGLSIIFILNLYMIQNGSKASFIKNMIYLGFIARLISLLVEYFVVLRMEDLKRTNQLAFELSLYSLITSSFFSCSGLFRLKEAAFIYTLYLIAIVYAYYDAEYDGLFYSLVLQNLVIGIFNTIEIRLLDKRQDKSFRNFLQIESESYKMSEFVGRLLPKHVLNNIGNFSSRLGETYKNVTLLYADIVGFTAFSSTHSSREVVEMLSRLFTSFDIECQKLGLFKIYTIGDCYVVMSFTDKNNRKDVSNEADRVVKLGIKMIEIIQSVRKKLRIDLNMRIGIHTGDIIAGIVGTELVRFDIYGENVVTANKMESKGEEGKICVSSTTRDFLESSDTCRYEFEEHKVIQVGGKEVSSYFVKF